MALHDYNTIFDKKPARVNIIGSEIEVQVGGRTGQIWKLDKTLTPVSYQISIGSQPAEYRKDEGSGLITRCRTEAQGWQVVTPETDKELASFAGALAVIDAVSSKPGFPPEIKAKLPAAHNALGFAYSSGQQLG